MLSDYVASAASSVINTSFGGDTCVFKFHVSEGEVTTVFDVESKLPTALQREVLKVKVMDTAVDAVE